jgi:RsiW-degrading membrane proteinase PrsW (M82 family)
MTEDRRSPRLNFEMALVVLLILILAWAPFPYGSNRPWAQSVLALLVGALLMLWVGCGG